MIGVSSISNLVSTFLSDPNRAPTGNQPKAYINWILFDENFKMVGGSFDKVSENGSEVKSHAVTGITVPKNGYLYVYASNESTVSAYFDNLQVVHTRDHILEETHYYPFGLSMHAISSEAAIPLKNRFKYNGAEDNNDLGLNHFEFFYRSYDPQLGRWNNIDTRPVTSLSPYLAMGNNPILFNDLLGDTLRGVNATSAQRTLEAAKCTFEGIEGGEAVANLFSLAEDGVSFANIDEDAFEAAYNGLESDEAKALATGYFKLINNDETHFVAMLKEGESLDLSNAKNLSDGFKKFIKDVAGIGSGTPAAAATGGNGGITIHSLNYNQGLTTISLNPRQIHIGLVYSNGKKKPAGGTFVETND